MQRALVTTAMIAAAALTGCAGGATAGGVARPTAPPTVAAPDAPAADGSAQTVAGPETPVAANGTWIGASGSSDFVLSGTHDSFMGVWVDVPALAKKAHTPMAVALVIDTSGSMAGPKIEHARQAARSLVESLSDGDIVAVDTFSDDARERIPATRLDRASRARIVASLGDLGASGGTNLFEGLRLGETTVVSAPATHPVRRIVVISDGIATVGATSPELLGALAARGADRGVQVTSIGVGLDYDENTLNTLAVRSSGRLYHLAEPREMAQILDREVKLLDSTMAVDAFVEIVPAPGVQILGVDNNRSDWQGGGALRVPLGTMFGGQHREMLVRVRVTAEGEGSRPLASVRLHFRDPADGNLPRVQEVIARNDVTSDPTLVERHANTRARAIAAVQEAAQVAITAAQAVNADRFDEADRQLAAAEQKMRDTAKVMKDKKEQERVLASAERISSARKSTAKAAAAPPAARPAAKRAGALDANSAGMSAAGF